MMSELFLPGWSRAEIFLSERTETGERRRHKTTGKATMRVWRVGLGFFSFGFTVAWLVERVTMVSSINT